MIEMATARHPWADLTQDPAAGLYLIGAGKAIGPA